MRPNKIKQLWNEGKCPTLGWLSISNGFTAEIMARQGFDALCVDLQHGTSEANDVLPMLQAVSQTETVPFVRVAWNDPASTPIGNQPMAFSEHYTSTQASRIGRTSITFFVKEGAKPMIRAALADGGYGTSYQEGLVNMLNDLLESQDRKRVA